MPEAEAPLDSGQEAGAAPPQAAPMQGEEMQDDSAPDSAPTARQAQAGQAGVTARGVPAPLAGGERGAEPPGGRPPPRRPAGRPDPNPLRNLGDALERWRANLAVKHEATDKPAGEGGEGWVEDGGEITDRHAGECDWTSCGLTKGRRGVHRWGLNGTLLVAACGLPATAHGLPATAQGLPNCQHPPN